MILYDTSTISDETEDFAIIFTKHERFRNNSRIIDTRLMEDELFSRWAVNSMSREDFDKKIASKRISFKYAACETSETFICNDEVFAQQTSMMSIKNKPNKGAVTSWKEYRAVLRRFWWKLYGNNGTDFDYNLYNTIVDGKDPFEKEQSSNTKEKTKKKSIAPNRLLLSEDQVDGFQALGLRTVAVALVIILYYLIIYLVVYTYRNRIFVNFT